MQNNLVNQMINFQNANILREKSLFFSCLVFITLLLQACAPSESPSADTPTSTQQPIVEPSPTIQPTATEIAKEELTGEISIWHSFEEKEMESFRLVIDNFQEMHPEVEFDPLFVPSYDIINKYESDARIGFGPCMLIGSQDWGPPLFDAGLIHELSGLANEELLATINPVALGSVMYVDSLIGLPLNTTGIVPFRNKSIMPDAPSSFDELVNYSQEATSGDVVGAYLDYGLFFSGGHLDGVGGKLMDSDGNPTFNNQQGLEWMGIIQRFDEAGPVEHNNDDDINLFLQNKVGFIIAGLWNTNSFAEAIGLENLIIDPWPTPLSGYVQTNNIYLNPNSTTLDQETCWNFAEFMLSKQSQNIFADPDMAGFIPSVLGIRLVDTLQMQAMNTFTGGAVFPINPEMRVYWDPVNNALLSVMEQGIEPAEALQSAHDEVADALETIRDE